MAVPYWQRWTRGIPLGAVALFLWLFYYQWAPALIPTLIVPPHHATIPGDAGDSRFNLLMIEHTFQWLLGREDLFSPPFYFPLANVGGFSDLHVGSVLAYAPWRLIGLDMFISLQLWVALGLLANYASAYVVARRFGIPQAGAAIAAACFTFAPPSSGYAGWLQLLWRPAVPFATYWTVQFALRMRDAIAPSAFRLLVVAGWVGFAFLCAPYTGILTAFWLAFLFVAVYLGARRSDGLRSLAGSRDSPTRFELVAAPVMIAAAGSVALGYARTASAYGISHSFGAASGTPGPWAWLFTTTSVLWNPVADQFRAHMSPPDRALLGDGPLFVGVALAALVAYAIWVRQAGRPWVGWIGLAILGTAIGITASSHISLFVLLSQLPGFGAVRGPDRIVLELLFPLGLLAGVGFAAISERVGSRGRYLASALVVADLTLVFVPATTVEDWTTRSDEIVRLAAPAVATASNPVLLVLPDKDSTTGVGSIGRIDAMLAGRQLGIPTINGYTSQEVYVPDPNVSCATLDAWLNDLPMSWGSQWPRVDSEREYTVLAVAGGELCLATWAPAR